MQVGKLYVLLESVPFLLAPWTVQFNYVDSRIIGNVEHGECFMFIKQGVSVNKILYKGKIGCIPRNIACIEATKENINYLKKLL